MKLYDYCIELTKHKGRPLSNNIELGLRIMCPEYSVDRIDVKTFPFPGKEDLFMLCWNIEQGGRLYASMKPYEKPFSYHCVFTPGGKTQYHTHDYIELAYVLEGEFRQRIMGNDILFQKGELCLIDKNCPHQDYLVNQSSMILFLGLANEIFDEVMVENIGEEKLLNFLQTALLKQKDIRQYLHFKPKDMKDRGLEDLLLQLFMELEKNDAASKYISKGLIMRILHDISTGYDFRLSRDQRKKMNWLVYEEITGYIEKNYASITVKELADRFHFNEDYYNRILKEKTGMTYLKFVQEIRLKNAYRLLKTTDMTVDEVADQIGYRNKGYFYKIFVQKYGIKPAKLRK